MLGCPYQWGGGENMREAAAAAAATRPPPVWRGFHPSIQSTPPHQRRDESGVGPAAAEAEARARRGRSRRRTLPCIPLMLARSRLSAAATIIEIRARHARIIPSSFIYVITS